MFAKWVGTTVAQILNAFQEVMAHLTFVNALMAMIKTVMAARRNQKVRFCLF